VPGDEGAALWQSLEWDTVDIELTGGATAVEVCNAWDCGNGVKQSWHNGAAMIVEEIPHGRRYRCNDGYADDDFDDIIFRLERL